MTVYILVAMTLLNGVTTTTHKEFSSKPQCELALGIAMANVKAGALIAACRAKEK